MSVEIERFDDVIALRLAAPPVNALSERVRDDFAGALIALRGEAPSAVLIAGSNGRFVSGASIDELDRPVRPPGLLEIESAIAAAPAPVIACIDGPALGGGLLLALMADVRLASPRSTFGFPEVTLGLLPTFGGTQIAPRLLGIAQAGEMIAYGRPIDARAALALGLIDAVVDGLDPVHAGLDWFARHRPIGRRRLLDAPLRGSAIELDAIRADVALTHPGFEAPLVALDAIAAGVTHDLADALAFEHRAFETLRGSVQSRDLRALFFAERAARKPPWGEGVLTHARSCGLMARFGCTELAPASTGGAPGAEALQAGIDVLCSPSRHLGPPLVATMRAALGAAEQAPKS